MIYIYIYSEKPCLDEEMVAEKDSHVAPFRI
jgi:hypothetical protein